MKAITGNTFVVGNDTETSNVTDREIGAMAQALHITHDEALRGVVAAMKAEKRHTDRQEEHLRPDGKFMYVPASVFGQLIYYWKQLPRDPIVDSLRRAALAQKRGQPVKPVNMARKINHDVL